MTRLLVIAGLAASGCAVGAGSARVGQWTARRETAFEACLSPYQAPAQIPLTATSGSAPPPCSDRKQVSREIPARRFWGAIYQLALGYGSTQHGSESFGSFRMSGSLELLRGRGRWAYGVRGGMIGSSAPAANDKSGLFGCDITLMGHLSVHERFGLYAGLGYLPYSTVGDDTTFLGGRGLVGLQYALNKTHSDNSMVLTLELDQVRLADLPSPYRSIGALAALGLFF